MPLVIDRSRYASAPRSLSVSTGTTLLGQLIDVATDPKLDVSPALTASAAGLGEVLIRAQTTDDAAVAATATATAAGDVDLDKSADRTLKALNLRLEAAVLLDDGDPAERAAEHLALLYPEGMTVSRAAFAAQDAVMQRMLRQLKSPELRSSVQTLAGEKYVTALETVAGAYHTMVKAMGRVVETNVDQRSMLSDIQTIIVQHCSRILGELHDADPNSVHRTRVLLAPIDNFRARTSTPKPPEPKPAATPQPDTAADDDAET
jgi:hypothetical protein